MTPDTFLFMGRHFTEAKTCSQHTSLKAIRDDDELETMPDVRRVIPTETKTQD